MRDMKLLSSTVQNLIRIYKIPKLSTLENGDIIVRDILGGYELVSSYDTVYFHTNYIKITRRMMIDIVSPNNISIYYNALSDNDKVLYNTKEFNLNSLKTEDGLFQEELSTGLLNLNCLNDISFNENFFLKIETLNLEELYLSTEKFIEKYKKLYNGIF